LTTQCEFPKISPHNEISIFRFGEGLVGKIASIIVFKESVGTKIGLYNSFGI